MLAALHRYDNLDTAKESIIFDMEKLFGVFFSIKKSRL